MENNIPDDVNTNAISERKYSTLLKVVVVLLRLFVGGVFIFSGFLKAIDPWGTIYKFNEYLIVFGLSDYLDLSSFLATVVAISEFVLGIMTFTGIYRRLAPLGILIMMLVMLPLTLYLAITNVVSDCGCFGDFIQLSNTATFVKNIFITTGAILLLIYNCRLVNYFGVAVQWLIVVASTIYVGTITFIGLYYQPMLDFRDFKVGTAIVEQASDDEKSDIQFIYSNGIEQRVFAIDNLPEAGSEWQFIDRVVPENPEKDRAFLSIISDGDDITEKVIDSEDKMLLLLFPDIDKVEISYTFAINELYDFASRKNIKFVALTAGNDSIVERWRDLSMAAYEIYNIDDSILKQIARGNPAIVYVENGKIVWKTSMQSIPLERFEESIASLSDLSTQINETSLLRYSLFYVGFLFLLLIINRTHRLPKINRFLEARYKSLIGEQ